MNNTENSRNKRRDAKHRQRYNPVRLGMPQGLTKAQLIRKKLKAQQDKKKDGGSDDLHPKCWTVLSSYTGMSSVFYRTHSFKF